MIEVGQTWSIREPLGLGRVRFVIKEVRKDLGVAVILRPSGKNGTVGIETLKMRRRGATLEKHPDGSVVVAAPKALPVAVPKKEARSAGTLVRTFKPRGPDKATRCAALRREGLPIKVIAERVGLHPATVKKYLTMGGVPT